TRRMPRRAAPEDFRDQAIAAEYLRQGLLKIDLPDESDALLDFRKLLALAGEQALQYQSADPFPHLVIDDFLPPESLRAVVEALPRLDDPNLPWGNLDANLADGRAAQAKKFHLQNTLMMKAPVRRLIGELNSGPFMVVLQRLSGIQWLLPDPHLQGGGVHIV